MSPKARSGPGGELRLEYVNDTMLNALLGLLLLQWQGYGFLAGAAPVPVPVLPSDVDQDIISRLLEGAAAGQLPPTCLALFATGRNNLELVTLCATPNSVIVHADKIKDDVVTDYLHQSHSELHAMFENLRGKPVFASAAKISAMLQAGLTPAQAPSSGNWWQSGKDQDDGSVDDGGVLAQWDARVLEKYWPNWRPQTTANARMHSASAHRHTSGVGATSTTTATTTSTTRMVNQRHAWVRHFAVWMVACAAVLLLRKMLAGSDYDDGDEEEEEYEHLYARPPEDSSDAPPAYFSLQDSGVKHC